MALFIYVLVIPGTNVQYAKEDDDTRYAIG